MKLDKIFLFILAGVIMSSCVDLNYTEENTRDEEWTYEYFANGIKNMVFDVYAQIYNNEFESNSAYFLAGATDEAQYALETGAVNNYVNGGWSPANPYSDTWRKAYTAIADIHMYLEKIEQTDLSEWKYNAEYDKWMQQIYDSYQRFFDERQWKKYPKSGAAREQRARDKRRQNAEATKNQP